MGKIEMETIIDDFKKLYEFEHVYFKLKEYIEIKNRISNFIFENNLDETTEWDKIKKNLVYTSQQYMTRKEADLILLQLESLKYIVLKKESQDYLKFIHPMIKCITSDKIKNGHYADAVLTAFKEINSRLKRIYIELEGHEKDGSDLMKTIFSPNNPILMFEELGIQSGKSIQTGYMEIFSGVMTGIRNPKAHGNIEITFNAAIKKLILASLLMDKIDQAIEFTENKLKKQIEK